MTHSATFQDTYFGATEMTIASFKTSRQGAKFVRFRWVKATGAEGCITTGFSPSGFANEAAAIAAANRHALFSNVA